MPGRSLNELRQRFTFQNQEQDREWLGESAIVFKYRVEDPRLGRFLSVDPLATKYVELTPYQLASNSPIWMQEIEGLEGNPTTSTSVRPSGSGGEVDAYNKQTHTDVLSPKLNNITTIMEGALTKEGFENVAQNLDALADDVPYVVDELKVSENGKEEILPTINVITAVEGTFDVVGDENNVIETLAEFNDGRRKTKLFGQIMYETKPKTVTNIPKKYLTTPEPTTVFEVENSNTKYTFVIYTSKVKIGEVLNDLLFPFIKPKDNDDDDE